MIDCSRCNCEATFDYVAFADVCLDCATEAELELFYDDDLFSHYDEEEPLMN